MLRCNRSSQVRCANVGVAEHRQATHEHMSNVDINEQARSQTQAHELSGSLTPCEDAQNKRRHPDRSRTKKIVSVSQTALRYAVSDHRKMITTKGIFRGHSRSHKPKSHCCSSISNCCTLGWRTRRSCSRPSWSSCSTPVPDP